MELELCTLFTSVSGTGWVALASNEWHQRDNLRTRSGAVVKNPAGQPRKYIVLGQTWQTKFHTDRIPSVHGGTD